MKPRRWERVTISPRKLGAKIREEEKVMNGSGPPLVCASVETMQSYRWVHLHLQIHSSPHPQKKSTTQIYCISGKL